MKRIVWRWLAISSLVWSSLVWSALSLQAETRPQYGGTLRVMMQAAPNSLDPANRDQPDSFARRSLTALLFDKLIKIDESGHVQGALAQSWQATRENRMWLFHIRGGVTFDDGTPLSAESVAASLRFANPPWNVVAEKDSVVIELKSPDPELPGELALPRNAIVKRDADQRVRGTGPFQIVEWAPGKNLRLSANENYWHGRPYLDAIEIEMGRDFREQVTALEVGRADLVEIPAEQVRRVQQQAHQLASSAKIELMALVFSADVDSDKEKDLRDALGLSVERGSIRNVLLQGTGDASGGVLPTWMSGYGFIFPANANLEKARQIRAQYRIVPTWTLGYDGSDVLARLVAERIALNGKDAGFSLQPTPSNHVDIHLARLALASSDPWIALKELEESLGKIDVQIKYGSIEELYAAERDLLNSRRVIPLFHLPMTYAAGPKLKHWSLQPEGSWDVSDAWLENGIP